MKLGAVTSVMPSVCEVPGSRGPTSTGVPPVRRRGVQRIGHRAGGGGIAGGRHLTCAVSELLPLLRMTLALQLPPLMVRDADLGGAIENGDGVAGIGAGNRAGDGQAGWLVGPTRTRDRHHRCGSV